MSGSRPTVGIRISAEGADKVKRDLEALGPAGEKAFGTIQRGSDAASPALQKVAGASDAVVRSLGSMGGVAGSAAAGLMSAATAGAALGTALAAGIGAAVRSAEQFERLSLRTEAVVKATGGAAGVSAEQIRELSHEIARTTLASTAGVEAAAQKLLTFRTIAGDTFSRTLRAAQDLAEVGLGSIDSAALQLGKALENPIEGLGALTRVGVSFSQQQKDVIKSLVETGQVAEAQRLILEAVERQVGGTGVAANQGLAGAYDTLGKNVEDFLTTIGNRGPIQLATGALQALAGVVQELHGLVTPRSASVAARAAVEAAESQLAAAERAQSRRGLLGGALSMGEGAREIERARVALAEAKAAEEQVLVDAYARQAALAAQAVQEQAAIQREAAAGRLTALRQSLNPIEKLEAEHADRVMVLRQSVARGLITEAEETALLTQEKERHAAAIDRLTAANRGRVASVRAVAAAETEAQKAAEKAAAGARAEQEKARRAAEQEIERFNRDIAREAERVADDIATNLFDSITDPSRATSVLDFFQNIFRRIAIQALSANIILPITTSVIGGAPGMFGITAPGGVAGAGGPGGLASFLPSGLTGLGGRQLISPGGGYISPIGEMGAPLGGITLGGALSGMALGAGAGGLLASLTGGNAIGGTVGGGLGGLGGSLLGALPAVAGFLGPLAPFAGIIGGLLGGGLGGLIGPGPSVEAYGLRLQSDAFADGNGMGAGLLPIDRQYYNERGAQTFAQADALVEAVNRYLSERGVQVGGAGIVEGNRNGAGNLGEAFARLRFGSADNALLGSFLGGQSFDDPAKLQAAVDGFLQAQAIIEALGAEAVPAFTAQLKAVNDNFDEGVEAARKYGLAEDNLTTARARAIASLETARAETLRQAGVSLDIRAMMAAGDSQGAELARQAEAAAQELASFTDQLDALATAAEDKAALLVRLEGVQAAERAAIIERFGGTANAALRAALDAGNFLRDLTFGRNSALAPEQQYFAAVSSLNAAQRDLDAGGSLSDFTAIAAQVLPVAGEFLGRSSRRYAELTSQIGSVVASNGGDNAGLATFLNASAGSMDNLSSAFASYGDATVSELRALKQEFHRMNATLEALITRRSAA